MQEQDLIARSQAGDLDAFNRLVELYQTQVFNLAFRIVGSMGPAEDAAQESFISAFRAIHTFRGGSFRGWLMRIVTNAAYDQLRTVQRRPAAAQSALKPQAAPAPLAADGGTTERSLATEADAPVAAEIEAAVEPPAAAIPAQRFPWLALEIAAGALMTLAMTATFRPYRRSRASSGGGQSE